MRIRFTTVRGQVTVYTVQYETTINGKRVPVLRYDNAHGVPHRDFLDIRGDAANKEWFPDLDNGEALTQAIADSTKNWKYHQHQFESE